jgi:hypothetical protein
METARYLLEHPAADPDWKRHVAGLIGFVERTFVVDVPGEPAVQWGAPTVSEQSADMNKMGSHTARYASVLALWSERTGDVAAREKAWRAFNWATYMCRENGFVHVGPIDQGLWFTDGYADYIRHFMKGMGAVAEWAPDGESHLLRSTSTVRSVAYTPARITYETFDRGSEETLKLAFVPKRASAGGSVLPAGQADARGAPGWWWDAARKILRVRHAGGRVVIEP